MKSINELLEKSIEKKGAVIAVAVAQDGHVLEAVNEAYQLGIADFKLVGDKREMEHIAKSLEIDLTPFEIFDIPEAIEATYKAVELVSNNRASALMKGLVDTSIVMKAALDKQIGLRTDKKLSHIAVFEVPMYHKLVYVTDSAINIAPDLNTKKEIIQNAVDAVRKTGIHQPKVALLAAKEKVDEKMPVTLEYEKLVEMSNNGEIENSIIAGPLPLDVAVSKDAAETKKVENPVCGDADILFCPNIESGNILYKSLAFLADAKNGGIVLGAKAPIIMTSRADSSESKLIAIALGTIFN
ncbi:MAG: Phosphate butyryltransferase [Bacillales bacterium]|jgi:phosphate butyryltransferase|nr:Phosphate butyryltransferase [Bacillales bacterium]